jgi:hypothetical protein
MTKCSACNGDHPSLECPILKEKIKEKQNRKKQGKQLEEVKTVTKTSIFAPFGGKPKLIKSLDDDQTFEAVPALAEIQTPLEIGGFGLTETETETLTSDKEEKYVLVKKKKKKEKPKVEKQAEKVVEKKEKQKRTNKKEYERKWYTQSVLNSSYNNPVFLFVMNVRPTLVTFSNGGILGVVRLSDEHARYYSTTDGYEINIPKNVPVKVFSFVVETDEKQIQLSANSALKITENSCQLIPWSDQTVSLEMGQVKVNRGTYQIGVDTFYTANMHSRRSDRIPVGRRPTSRR